MQADQRKYSRFARYFLLTFWLLSTVERTTAATLFETSSIELTANDSVAKTDVLYTTTADQNYRVLLEVVTFTGDVGSDFHAVRQADASDFTDSRVWFTRSLGGNASTNTALKW